MYHPMSAGPTSVGRFSTSSAGTRRTFVGATSQSRFGTGAGSATTNHWSGSNHHHHHHGSVVFIGDFGYPFGYPYWYDGFYPYGYGYGYGYGYDNYDPAGYGNTGAYDGSLVAQVQTRLARAGLYRGAIDGVIGPETRRAIRAFQRSNGLRADGTISRPLIATMGLG